MLKVRSILAVVVLASVGAQAQAGTNLLNNPGFESPLGFDFSDVTNWNGFFGGPAGTFLQAFNDTGAAPFSGAQALVTTIQAGTDPNGWNAFTGHVQTVPVVVPGALYELSVYARTNPSINTGAEFRIEWFDAGNNFISALNTDISGSLTPTYTLFSASEAAPLTAASAKIVLAVQSFVNDGNPANTSVAWDDASFGIIPSPGAVSLLGFAGIAALRRRR